jgi:hypothetical protein
MLRVARTEIRADRGQDGFDTQSLNAFSVFHDTRRRIPAVS